MELFGHRFFTVNISQKSTLERLGEISSNGEWTSLEQAKTMERGLLLRAYFAGLQSRESHPCSYPVFSSFRAGFISRHEPAAEQ